MKRANVLLTASNAKYIHSNPALYSLRANAGIYKEQIQIAEYTINHREDEILRGIYLQAPDIVGFSCYIWNIRYVLDVAEELKKVLPDVVIVLGGPEVSYDAPELLRRYPFIDFILMGEGERSFREFLACCIEDGVRDKIMDVPGICQRNGDEIVTSPQTEMADMDELAFPYREIEGMQNRIIYYETMRGCPFACSYCLSSIEKRVRKRNLSLVLEELQFFLDHKVKQVKFVDRTFNCDHEHAYRIWEYIGKHDNGTTNFHFEIGGDLLRQEDVELIRRFRPGLMQFEIGVQSTNPDTLAAIRRMTDLAKLRHFVRQIHEAGNIHQHLDLIAGLPYEDYESFHESFNDVYAMMPDQLQLGFLKILKGSYMEECLEEYAIRYGAKPPYEVLATKWLSYDEILKLKQVEEMVEVYYNSFQFPATMALLELCQGDAFLMYEQLGSYYAECGHLEKKHSRLARYEILWKYVNDRMPEEIEAFRQTLTYDLYLREYVKTPPAFVRERDSGYLQAVRRFLERETKEPEILSGYEGYAPRQLFHMIYVDEFTLDMGILQKRRQRKQCPPYSLAFDYKNRNPLNRSARTAVIPDFSEWKKEHQ